MFKEKNKQEIDDTFDIQHIFMKNFLQHLKKEEKFGLKFSNVLFRKKKNMRSSIPKIDLRYWLYFETRNEIIYIHIIYT